MQRWLERSVVWLLRMAALGLALYHVQWAALVTPAFLVRAFSETLAPARAVLPLVTPASLLGMALVLFRVSELVVRPARGPRAALSVLWVVLVQQLAAASLAHESYADHFGEGLFVARPHLNEIAGWGPLLLGTGGLVALAARGPGARFAREGAGIPERAARWAATAFAWGALACAAFTIVELSPDEHVEHVSNLAAMAVCAVGLAAVHAARESAPSGPRDPSSVRAWTALGLGLLVLHVVSRQEIITAMFSYRFIETTGETMLFTQGRIWNAAAIGFQLALGLIGAVVLLHGVASSLLTPTRPARGEVSRGWMRVARCVPIASGALLGGLAVAAAGAIVADGQSWLAGAELIGLALTLAAGGLEWADGMAPRHRDDPRLAAGPGAVGVAIGLLVTLLGALLRLRPWL